MKPIRQETALITGASAGIGAELARVFARNGHDLVLAARRKDRLEQLAAELRAAHGIEVAVFAADLGAADGASKLHEEVNSAGHPIAILVNNAGVLAEAPFLDTELEAHRQIVGLNVSALLELTHRFGRDMRARGHGRILNICSTSAFQPVPKLASYAASKAFVLSLSEALSIENARHGITVTALCPGFTQTEMIQKGNGEHMSLPLVRVLTPQEVAEQGYRALMKGKPVYINGLSNQLIQAVVTRQPRWLSHRLAKVLQRRGL